MSCFCRDRIRKQEFVPGMASLLYKRARENNLRYITVIDNVDENHYGFFFKAIEENPEIFGAGTVAVPYRETQSSENTIFTVFEEGKVRTHIIRAAEIGTDLGEIVLVGCGKEIKHRLDHWDHLTNCAFSRIGEGYVNNRLRPLKDILKYYLEESLWAFIPHPDFFIGGIFSGFEGDSEKQKVLPELDITGKLQRGEIGYEAWSASAAWFKKSGGASLGDLLEAELPKGIVGDDAPFGAIGHNRMEFNPGDLALDKVEYPHIEDRDDYYRHEEEYGALVETEINRLFQEIKAGHFDITTNRTPLHLMVKKLLPSIGSRVLAKKLKLPFFIEQVSVSHNSSKIPS
ncbi:hypothetical protein CMO89_03080 [Candidatus Woesearchaeota archaeon]|nr:hypothetical protein [Candidatus Woesearchaeota archaeon]